MLKPQREGGGNNIFGPEIVEILEKLSPEERGAYILMEKIKPCPRVGFLMKKGKVEKAGIISELGLLSYFITDKDRVIKNIAGGYLLRSKVEKYLMLKY